MEVQINQHVYEAAADTTCGVFRRYRVGGIKEIRIEFEDFADEQKLAEEISNILVSYLQIKKS